MSPPIASADAAKYTGKFKGWAIRLVIRADGMGPLSRVILEEEQNLEPGRDSLDSHFLGRQSTA